MTDKTKRSRKRLAKKLGVSRRTAANIISGRAASSRVPNTPAQRQAMVRDVMVRRFGGVVDAHYVILRYDPGKAETLTDAVLEARSEAATRSDLQQVAIRRADQPGHPWVCRWTREAASDPWQFEWMPGCDDSGAAPLALATRAVSAGMDWFANPESFPYWAQFLAQLDADELRCLRRMFDHDLGPLSPVWAEVWDSLFVTTAAVFGFRIGIARARDLLVNLTTFGALRRNAHSSSETSPSFAVTEAFLASSKAIGNWFDLEGAARTKERLAALHDFQVISTNLSRFSNVASRMNTASRIVARAQVMGQLIDARGRHPNFAGLFEQLRLEHHRACAAEARIVEQSRSDAPNGRTVETIA